MPVCVQQQRSTMQAASAEDEHPIDAALNELRSDVPCLTNALKNWCSVLSARALETEPAKPRQPPQPPQYALADVLKIAQVVLRVINAHSTPQSLPSQHAWAEKHPQREDETASARVEALTRYRAASLLVAQIAEALPQQGAKPTKLFGRKFLQATHLWEDAVRDAAAAQLAAAGTSSPATVTAFLDGFGACIGHQQDSEEPTDASLIWADNFEQALAKRRAVREAEVQSRRQRMEAGENEADMLRSALNAEEATEDAEWSENDEEDDDHEPRVVEVADSS